MLVSREVEEDGLRGGGTGSDFFLGAGVGIVVDGVVVGGGVFGVRGVGVDGEGGVIDEAGEEKGGGKGNLPLPSSPPSLFFKRGRKTFDDFPAFMISL